MPKKSHIRTASEVICFSNLRLQKAGYLNAWKAAYQNNYEQSTS